jgi:hypothetical protein
VSPVRYELCFYISEDGILHSYRRESLKCYTFPFSWVRQKDLFAVTAQRATILLRLYMRLGPVYERQKEELQL